MQTVYEESKFFWGALETEVQLSNMEYVLCFSLIGQEL